jgi:hypothetical protein
MLKVNIANVCVQQRKTRLVRAKDVAREDDQASPMNVMMIDTLKNKKRCVPMYTDIQTTKTPRA